MTEKNPLLYIVHILESIKLIQKYLGDCSKKQLSENHMMYDAILRNLQTLSESVQRIPDEIPQIPWKDISVIISAFTSAFIMHGTE
jgi:uncharacterized protein with HEPN domain